MGKNHRHQKQLKSEKAKVKLKQTKTKFLPKGLNVTNTNFQIKPIVIHEQLKSHEGETILSNRKLNVKDLLDRLKHHNENVRYGACEELSQVIKPHAEEIVQSYLAEIIQTVNILIQDRESKVRTSAIKVINAILEVTPPEKIEVFFRFFLINLCCAMTNINSNIQEDSLLLLDSLLTYVPKLVAKYCEKILTNFFTLISKLRNDSNVNRTLTVNLGSRMTSVKWRIQVLSRLYNILKAIVEIKSTKEENNKLNSEMDLADGIRCNRFLLYKTQKSLDNEKIFYELWNFRDDKNKILLQHIETLVPLLFETWMEVLPDKDVEKVGTDSTILTEDAALVLSCVVNILCLLYEYLQTENISNRSYIQNIFLSSEGKKFFNYLLLHFPYVQSGQKSQQSKELAKIMKITVDSKCIQENILICYMFSVLYINNYSGHTKIDLKSLGLYINKCLLSKKMVNSLNSKYFLKILRACLVNNPMAWNKCRIPVNEILDSCICFYNHTRNDELKLQICTILSKVDKGVSENHFEYRNWIIHLPRLLCQREISYEVIKLLLDLSRTNNKEFQIALKGLLPLVLENLTDLVIQPSSKKDFGRTYILHTINYLPSTNRNVLKEYFQKYYEKWDLNLRIKFLDLVQLNS